MERFTDGKKTVEITMAVWLGPNRWWSPDMTADILEVASFPFDEELGARMTNAPWSNEACQGYLIAALRAGGKRCKEIEQALDCLYRAFDQISVEEAKQIWKKF